MSQRQITSETVHEIDADFDDTTGIDDDAKQTENDISEELGASPADVRFKLKVFRIPTNGKKFIWLFDRDGYDVAGLSEYLRDNYGTGMYQAQVWKNGQLNRKHAFAVELPKSGPVANATGDALTTLVQQMGAQMAAMTNQLAELRRAPAPVAPAIDPMATFNQMGAMMETMRKIMGPPPVAADPFAMLKSVIGLVKEANSESREKGVMDLVGDVLQSDLLKSVVQNMTPQQQQPQPQMQAPRLAAPPGTQPQMQPAPAPAPAPQPAPPQDANAKAFNDLLALLVSRAAKNSDPVLYADFIEDALAPEMLEQLLAMPDPVGLLAQYNPEVSTHRDWFASVIEALTDTGEQEQMPGAPIAAPSGSIDATVAAAPAASNADVAS